MGWTKNPKILLLLLLPLLLFAGTSGAEVVDRIVAVINDQVITLSELNAASSMAMEALGVEQKERQDEVRRKILDGLIEQKLIKQAADRAGIDVSEKEIDNAVDEVKKENGLSHEALLLELARSGLTLDEYRGQLKEQIREVKFINAEFRSKINIEPEEVEEYYTHNIETFYGPGEYRIRMMLLSAPEREQLLAKLDEVMGGLQRGEDFSSLARQYSNHSSSRAGGDMGFLRSGEMDGAMEEAVKNLKPGELSPPVERPEGIYIIQLVEKKEGEPKPLEEVRGQIQDKLFNRKMDERFSAWLKDAKKAAHIDVRF